MLFAASIFWIFLERSGSVIFSFAASMLLFNFSSSSRTFMKASVSLFLTQFMVSLAVYARCVCRFAAICASLFIFLMSIKP